MPVKARLRKLKDADYPELWEKRPVSRERWERHRESLLANAHAGSRPPEWWAYQSPNPRDLQMAERLQLYEMGELRRAELDELMPFWKEWEEKARGLHFTLGPGKILEGRAAYLAWRRWAGIPDDLFPPAKDLRKISVGRNQCRLN